MALYDAKEKKKISETFHLDCNPSDIQHMLDDYMDERSMASLSRSGIFNITYPNSDVFLIVKVMGYTSRAASFWCFNRQEALCNIHTTWFPVHR